MDVAFCLENYCLLDACFQRNYDYVAFYAEKERRTMLAGKFSGRKSTGEKV
jgi:hypothetical protein